MEHPGNFSRVKTLGSLYYKQAELSYLSFLKLDRELAASPIDPSHMDYFENTDTQTLAGVQTIVFSARCVEAAAYDYAATHLGDDFVLKHLDKLDVISKWIASLRLISNYEISKHGALYSSLKCLVRSRNLLVHIKSEDFDAADPLKQHERLEHEGKQLKSDVHESFKCLPLMSLTLQKFAPIASYHLPCRFLDLPPIFDPIPKELSDVINDCRRILSASVEG